MTEETSNLRNPLVFILLIVLAAGITGGAVWFATRHQAPAVADAAPEAAAPAAATTEAAPAAPAAPVEAFTTAQKTELDSLIKDFIMKNPDVIIQSLQAGQPGAESVTAKEGRLQKVPDGLYDYPLTPFVGPKDAKLVVVEFFDYNCGFCKRVVPDFVKLIGEEPDVKFMFKELPILSAESEVAARFALAANKQGKYIEYHTALMEHQGPISQELIEKTATDVGLDLAQLKKDADGADVAAALQKNMALARELGVQGTPFFVIGKERVPGAVGYTRLKDMINQERAELDPKAAIDSSVATDETDNTTDTESASPTKTQQDEPITE
ncbi:MAG TPA: DsbA family protein [Alphaproteobacteria bacterium]